MRKLSKFNEILTCLFDFSISNIQAH